MEYSDDWVEYKKLILGRLNDMGKMEEDIVTIKIQLAVLTTKVIMITASVALVTSAFISAIMNNFLKGA